LSIFLSYWYENCDFINVSDRLKFKFTTKLHYFKWSSSHYGKGGFKLLGKAAKKLAQNVPNMFIVSMYFEKDFPFENKVVFLFREK